MTRDPQLQSGSSEVAALSNSTAPLIDRIKDIPAIELKSKGENVIVLQEALARLGFFQGQLIGNFGPKTHTAVLQFQIQHNIISDSSVKGAGVFGPRTKAALLAALSQLAQTVPTQTQAPVPTHSDVSLDAQRTQEQELTELIAQLRQALGATIPELGARVDGQDKDISTLRSQLDTGELPALLTSLREIHAASRPLMDRLRDLAEAATPDQETTARIDTHSSAILKTQQHLLHLRDLASKFENNVGRRLQVAQSDPRKLTISCGDFIDKLTKTDGHWKSAITGFCLGLLQHDSRILTDKNIHLNFPVVDIKELQKLGTHGFLPADFSKLKKQYETLSSGADPEKLQMLLKDVVFIGAEYPQMVLQELQRVLGGAYLTIDQGLLNQFAQDLTFLFHEVTAFECSAIPDGDTNRIRTIPSSYAPMPYVMGVDRPDNPAPDLKYAVLPSGLSFIDATNGSYLFPSSRPPAIKVALDDV